MITYEFTRHAMREFLKLPKDVRQRIVEKLEYYLESPDPLAYAKPLVADPRGAFRFHIGSYRVVFDTEDGRILITRVGHRKDIYRRP